MFLRVIIAFCFQFHCSLLFHAASVWMKLADLPHNLAILWFLFEQNTKFVLQCLFWSCTTYLLITISCEFFLFQQLCLISHSLMMYIRFFYYNYTVWSFLYRRKLNGGLIFSICWTDWSSWRYWISPLRFQYNILSLLPISTQSSSALFKTGDYLIHFA